MKEITTQILYDAANVLLFDLDEEECEILERDLSTLVDEMAEIAEDEDLEQFEPMTFPFSCETDFLREDIACEPLDREEVLLNARSTADGQIKLPRVV